MIREGDRERPFLEWLLTISYNGMYTYRKIEILLYNVLLSECLYIKSYIIRHG